MNRTRAKLVLEDGTEYLGTSFGADKSIAGEVVFNTGMVGYPETLTDPSYRGQILSLTYPLVGNYGIHNYELDAFGLPIGFESEKIQVAGLVVSEFSENYSHYDAKKSLGQWLSEFDVSGIEGIDTRALTRRLRNKGSMLGKIVFENDEVTFVDPMSKNLVAEVSPKEIQDVQGTPKGAPKVVLVDCGCKTSIARSLVKRGLRVTRVPYDHYFLDLDYDGLLISNGPGDPKMYQTTVRHVEHALAVRKPILGICLGHQMLALAAGADTYKLKFGHRGQNQPCVLYENNENGETVESKKCVITSQNHGYAVRPSGLSDQWKVWFKNANDDTVEGIRHKTKPFWSVQFHPEARPGPTDTAWIFDDFVKAVMGGTK